MLGKKATITHGMGMYLDEHRVKITANIVHVFLKILVKVFEHKVELLVLVDNVFQAEGEEGKESQMRL